MYDPVSCALSISEAVGELRAGRMVIICDDESCENEADLCLAAQFATPEAINLSTGIPVIFGVTCAENQQQAEERVVRGRECAQAAVEMAQTLRKLKNKADQQKD